ncbi:unnamed protein product [Phytophthora fragariaefolia]|uniref:Unnamed protein product n=1 Tax=Phytophthora fragariaefolia TaxID=1490495 RepID=A0A9W7CMJ8_9STRA|nr:unnamed protein product [Phytophthora fragariaefolia]
MYVAREDCLHLADPEWESLQRLATVIGEAALVTMLHTLSPTEQHGVALGFIMKEQHIAAARATVSTPSTPRVESLNFHVNSNEEERANLSSVDSSRLTLPLRLDILSTRCRRFRSPCHALAGEQGVGRTDVDSLILRALAHGDVDLLRRRARSPPAEPLVPRGQHRDHFEDDRSADGESQLPVVSPIQKGQGMGQWQARCRPKRVPHSGESPERPPTRFDPRQEESRMRAAFFALHQGKMSMRDYVQKTHHLVSFMVTNPDVTNPDDVASQVHVFIFGMREDMTRYCFTRAEPSSLETASALALREDYTIASFYARAITSDARASTPEHMEIDAIEAESRSWST